MNLTLAALVDRDAIPTPCFFFSANTVEQAVRYIRKELPATISYATKANCHPLMISAIRGLVDRFNITNVVQLKELLRCGVESSRIDFVHPAAKAEAYCEAFELGVRRFVVDDERGIASLKRLGASVECTVRVMPFQNSGTGRALTRFGCAPEESTVVAKKLLDVGLNLHSVSFYVGASNTRQDGRSTHLTGLDTLSTVVENLDRELVHLKAVNIGGGFPAFSSAFFQKLPEYFRNLRTAFVERFGETMELVVEPGRYFAQPSMSLYSRVVYDRNVGGRRLISVDASAYAGMFDTSFVDPDGPPPVIVTPMRDGERCAAELIGPLMDSYDVIQRNLWIPPLAEGDVVCFQAVGAYAWTYETKAEGSSPPTVIPVPYDVDV